MTVMAVTKFERFFRVVAGLHVDKQDLRRYSDFINQKIYDLLLRGQAAPKANVRDVMAFSRRGYPREAERCAGRSCGPGR